MIFFIRGTRLCTQFEDAFAKLASEWSDDLSFRQRGDLGFSPDVLFPESDWGENILTASGALPQPGALSPVLEGRLGVFLLLRIPDEGLGWKAAAS